MTKTRIKLTGSLFFLSLKKTTKKQIFFTFYKTKILFYLFINVKITFYTRKELILDCLKGLEGIKQGLFSLNR